MANDKRQNSAPDDLTPIVGAATDVAPLGHIGAKPPHELTADEDGNPIEWRRIAETPEFKNLMSAKRRFILPATLFFVVYYFALPVLVGYAPELMSTRVFGVLNIAYLFALSQFFMAWVIAALYVRAASRFDKMERQIIEKAREK